MATVGKKKKAQTRNHRHPFRFELDGVFGEKKKIITFWAKVKKATTPVELVLKAEHVRKSIKLKGIGNPKLCSMAICLLHQMDAFPHKVADGYIDWFYSRAFVVSRLNKDGFPAECYEYVHSDNIAKVNDTKAGQQKLLEELERDGDRVVILRPVPARLAYPPSPKGKNTGSRTKVTNLTGGAARYAHAMASISGG